MISAFRHNYLKNIFLIILISVVLLAVLISKEDDEVGMVEDLLVQESVEHAQQEAKPKADARKQEPVFPQVIDEAPLEPTCQEILAASPFYRADSLQVVIKEKELRQEGKSELADRLQAISCVPQGVWVSGRDPAWEVSRAKHIVEKAKQQGKIPLFVIYDGPEHSKATWRHVGTGKAYEEWMGIFASALGASSAWIVFEPDALLLAPAYSEEDRAMRLEELKNGVRILKEQNPLARVYIDAGHHQWKGAAFVVSLLRQAGIELADGFALNVSNHQTVSEEIAYGVQIATLIGNTHFIIDTGQAGKKVEGKEWCNAPGRALGQIPTTDTGNALVAAFVWAKPPGESDGICNGGPPPGKFWLEYALQLIANE